MHSTGWVYRYANLWAENELDHSVVPRLRIVNEAQILELKPVPERTR
jgi:hypothetical protein